jgi:hypothetical protein
MKEIDTIKFMEVLQLIRSRKNQIEEICGEASQSKIPEVKALALKIDQVSDNIWFDGIQELDSLLTDHRASSSALLNMDIPIGNDPKDGGPVFEKGYHIITMQTRWVKKE